MKIDLFGDVKNWCAISCPVDGLRFDARTLAFLDSDGDGHIRTPEVLAAVEFMKSKGVEPEELLRPASPETESRLADVLAGEKDLASVEPSRAEIDALAEWEAKGRTREVAILGDDTASAEASLAAVEKVIDEFFTPLEDMPLVTEEPEAELPLGERINPKFADAVAEFACKCVNPLCEGEVKTLSRREWKRIKAAFAPYRAWVAAKPVMNAEAKAKLEEEERFLRYRLHLGEFIENFCTMDRLYAEDQFALFQMGTLRIDAREMNLCFHVANEAAHSALAGKSECCVIYLKLSRPSEKAVRSVCAVVTAGRVSPLYVGRNGVFYDRDGKDWEAVVTKVVESQVSLSEAFWSPWKKLAAGISEAVKKFLGEKQAAGERGLSSIPSAKNLQQNGGAAAMASSFAAIGVSVGLMGAALASVMAAVRGFAWWQYPLAVVVIIMAVSLPSVVLSYFKLRRRDLGAILNASGWAVNRKLLFSMRLAKSFTRCAAAAYPWKTLASLAALLLAVAIIAWRCSACGGCEKESCERQSETQEVNGNAQAGK